MRTPLAACLLLSPFFLFSAFTPEQAPQASPAVSSAPANHSTDDSYAKEPYVYDLVQTAVRFEPDGKGYRDLILRVRIQSESAVHEFGLLVYSFSSKFESLEVVYARVRKPDGTVIETPASDVQELDSAVSVLFLLRAVGHFTSTFMRIQGWMQHSKRCSPFDRPVIWRWLP